MAIMVQFSNRSFGYISANDLNDLVATGKIVAYKWNEDWIDISNEPQGDQSGPAVYKRPEPTGNERKSCLTCSDFIDSACRGDACKSKMSLQTKGDK